MHRIARRFSALLVVLLLAASGGAAAIQSIAPAPATGLAADAPVPLVRVWDADVDAAMDEDLPEMETGIGPGSALRISIPSEGTFLCTANFVWTDDLDRLYLGTAGHCILPADKTATHGPGADYDASGVQVSVRTTACPVGTICSNYVPLGPVVYARYTDVGQDFAIVRIPDNLRGDVRHTLPAWGGPTGEGSLAAGQTALYFGHGVGIGGAGVGSVGIAGFGTVFATRGRMGTGLGGVAYWQATGPIQGGDSGAAVVSGAADLTGNDAVGILTHGAAASPSPVMFGTHVATAKAMVGAHTALRIWTLPGGAPLPGLEEPEPEETNETLAPGIVHLTITNNETTTQNATYHWTNDWSDVRVLATMQTTSGTARIEIRNEANETLLEATSAANVSVDETLRDTSLGAWVIHIAFVEHEGSLALRIEAADDDAGSGGNGSGGGSGGSGGSPAPPSGSEDDDDGATGDLDDGDANELPAVGALLLLVVTLGTAFIVRRRGVRR